MTTASGIERTQACPASEALPHIGESGEDAKRGTAIHHYVRSVIARVPRETALAAVPAEWRDTCAGIDFTKLCGDLSEVRSETAYALDLEHDSARYLGENLGRKYPPLKPTEIAGSIDIEGMRFDGIPVIEDVKTGRLEVSPAEENSQIRFFCRAKQLLLDAPVVEGRILYIGGDGGVRRDCHEFGAFDLESFQDDLRTMVRGVAEARAARDRGESLSVTSGDHCRYCPAKAACPKYTALARSMLPELRDVASRLQSMTPAEQGRAVLLAKDCERLLGTVMDALKELAREAPIPLPDGRTYRETSYERSDFVRDRAIAELRRRGASDGDIAKLYATSTVTSIKIVGRATGKGRAA